LWVGSDFITALSHLILTVLAMLVVICAIKFFSRFSLNELMASYWKEQTDFRYQYRPSEFKPGTGDTEELITKKHFESDKFYEMLVQSANDGISFYDRDWNLKYTNSAFYTMIGYDRDSYNSLILLI